MVFLILIDFASCKMKDHCPPQGPNSVDDAGINSNSVEGQSRGRGQRRTNCRALNLGRLAGTKSSRFF